MEHKHTHYLITFGAVIAMGLTMAIYKILTSNIVSSAIEGLIITIVSITGLAAIMSLVFFGIRINHIRRNYRIESDAKLIALKALENEHNPEIAIAILHGIPRQRKEIQNPIKTITNWRVMGKDERMEAIENDD